MMELEVRTDYQSRGGDSSGAYGQWRARRGLSGNANKKPANTTVPGPKDAKTNTVGNIFYGSNGYLGIDGYDAYKTWVTDQVEPGRPARVPATTTRTSLSASQPSCQDIHSPIEEAHISTTSCI